MNPKVTEEARTNSYSKSIMSTMVFLYLVGAMIGSTLVIISAFVNVRQEMPIDSSMFVAYAAFLATPTATAIGFYAWKSKAENVVKIAQSFKSEHVTEVMNTISEIGGN